MFKHSDSINELASALSRAQASINNVIRDKEGFGYQYADLAACLDAIREPLSGNGLSISQLPTMTENGFGLVTLLLHESGQWLQGFFPLSPDGTSKNIMQSMGSAITYVRRYSLAAILGLAQTDDDGSTAQSVNVVNVVNVAPQFLEAQQAMENCQSIDQLKAVWKRYGSKENGLSKQERQQLAACKDRVKSRLEGDHEAA